MQKDNLEPKNIPVNEYSLWTYEKLRYADTDRQGHVNNAIFATMLETGRVELLYNPAAPLHDQGCTFVIASLHLDLHAEITWPGNVDIGTRIATVGRSSLTIEQALFQNGICAATARTVIVQTNASSHHSQPLTEAAVLRLKDLIVAIP
ncbi:MAG: thioesterase [Proteobacteria bacterium]|nr:thioesterase [Pseudomonadota bacterium]